MASHSKKTETLIGFFLFVGCALLAGIILFFGQLSDLYEGNYEVKVNFAEAPGIIKGSTVRYRGVKIGVVGESPVLIGNEKIQVILKIDEGFEIDAGSSFKIGQASMIGDKEILISPPAIASGSYLAVGAEVTGSKPGGLDALQEEAEGIAASSREFIEEARGTLEKVDASLVDIKVASHELAETLEKVNHKVLSDGNLDSISGTLANFNQVSETFVRLSHGLKPTIDEIRATVSEVRETNQVAQGVIAGVEPKLEGVPDLVSSLEETANKATVAIDKASVAIEKVDNGEGTLGALISDKELKEDVQGFVKNLKSKGILRYKDEETPEEDPRVRFRGRRR